MNQDALKWMEMVEIDAPPTELVENLSTAQKQCVEIAKCLSHNAKSLYWMSLRQVFQKEK